MFLTSGTPFKFARLILNYAEEIEFILPEKNQTSDPRTHKGAS